jgi:DNA-directed RNA polymerase alpha subunit
MGSKSQQLHTLSLPVSALSALERKGVAEISDLSFFTESEISNLNGVGRKALEVLQTELRRHNLSFRKTEQQS